MPDEIARLLEERIYVPDGTSLDQAFERTTHLGVVAHADDLEILAYHGILQCYRDQSLGFGGVVVMDGAGAVRIDADRALSAEEYVQARRAEQWRAADRGCYRFVAQLGYPSAEGRDLRRHGVDGELTALLARARPEVLYTHSLLDRHESHVAVSLRTLRALRELPAEARPRTVLGVEVWGDLDWLPRAAKVHLDVGGEPELERDLLRVFESQVAAKRYDLATIGRRTAHATFSDSLAADATDRLCLAVDLSPLLEAPSFEPAAYVEGLIETFRADASARIARLFPSKGGSLR